MSHSPASMAVGGGLIGTLPNPNVVGENASLVLSERVFGARQTATSAATTVLPGTKTYSRFNPKDSNPPAAAYAQLDIQGDVEVVAFDATLVESIFFQDIVPEGASVSTFVVNIKWAAAAITGAVVWGVQFERMTTTLGVDSYDTAVEATTTTNGTTLVPSTTSITISTLDSIATGDAYRISVYRNATSGSDTMTGDALLFAVEVRAP